MSEVDHTREWHVHTPVAASARSTNGISFLSGFSRCDDLKWSVIMKPKLQGLLKYALQRI